MFYSTYTLPFELVSKSNKLETPALVAPEPAPVPVAPIIEAPTVCPNVPAEISALGVTITIKGKLIWVENTQFYMKDVLKKYGFRWAPKKRAWWAKIDAGATTNTTPIETPKPVAPEPTHTLPIEPTDTGIDNANIFMFPVHKIATDTDRFQNRTNTVSADSVNRIVAAFDPNKLDPVVLWKQGDTTYMLSGHSRLAAHQKLGRPTIPAKFFAGNEAEAITFARIDANRSATKENLVEDIRAFVSLRDGLNGVMKQTKEALKERFKNYNKLEAMSYLSTTGLFITTLNDDTAKGSFPYIDNKATWVGSLRKEYKRITNYHENELFEFLFLSPKGMYITKDDFMAAVSRKIARLDWEPSEPLCMNKDIVTGTEANSATKSSQAALYKLEAEVQDIKTRYNKAHTKEERKELQTLALQKLKEIEAYERGIKEVLRTQITMF